MKKYIIYANGSKFEELTDELAAGAYASALTRQGWPKVEVKSVRVRNRK